MRRLIFAVLALVVVFSPALAASDKKAATSKPASTKPAAKKPLDLTKYIVTFPWPKPERLVSLLGPNTGSQEWQNFMAAEEQLIKLVDRKVYEEMKRQGLLTRISGTEGIYFHQKFDPYWSWTNPWTKQFLADFASWFRGRYGKKVQVNSASRDVAKQIAIAGKRGRKNPNAAPVSGPKTSSHLYASSIDIGKLPMSLAEQQAAGAYLLELESLGLIEVTEEENQAVFHVMVSKKYLAWRAVQLAVSSH
jgi:hypothetical protein